jgi:hypothetical protein
MRSLLRTVLQNIELDVVDSTAILAYSLRQITRNYKGQCIRVRRSGDNAESDIGFVDGVLDTVSLLAFCGTSNGFVRTWYDQSGSLRHATQETILLQPQIVTGGEMFLINGRPSLYAANGRSLLIPLTGLIGGLTSAIESAVFVNPNTGNGGAYARISSQAVQNRVPFTLDGSAYISFLSTERIVFAGYGVSSQVVLHETVNTGTAMSVFKNNTQIGQTLPCSFSPDPSFGVLPDQAAPVNVLEYIVKSGNRIPYDKFRIFYQIT